MGAIRSKVEMCYDILKALNTYGPLKVTHIMYKTNINNSCVREILYNFILCKYVVIKHTDNRFPVGVDGGVRKYYNEVYELTDIGLKVFIEAKKVLEGTLSFPAPDPKRCFLNLNRKPIPRSECNNDATKMRS